MGLLGLPGAAGTPQPLAQESAAPLRNRSVEGRDRVVYRSAVALASLGLLLSAVSYSTELAGAGTLSHICGAGNECASLYRSEWALIPSEGVRETLNLPDWVSVPVTLAGVWHFAAALVGLTLIGPPRSHVPMWWKISWGSELAAASLYSGCLLGVMVVGKTFCPTCAVLHVIVIAMATCVYYSWTTNHRQAAHGESTTIRQLTASFLFAVSFGGNLVLLDRLVTDGVAKPQENGVDAFLAKPSRDVPVADDDSTLAAGQHADHTLVIFFDVQCPPCKQFIAHLLTEIVPSRSDSLAVVFKHFPLNSECNAGVNDVHPRACEFARILEAAKQEGGMNAFRRFLLLLEPLSESPSREDFEFMCRQSHLDADRLMAVVDTASIKERVKRHVSEGKSLGISGTPSLFLDGRELDMGSAASPAFWDSYLKRTQANP